MDSAFALRLDLYLDRGSGSCLLREHAELVANALRHFDGTRYALHAWCVMPNHVHVLFHVERGRDVPRILHSWKSYTSHEIGRGEIWDTFGGIRKRRDCAIGNGWDDLPVRDHLFVTRASINFEARRDYRFAIPALRDAESIELRTPVTFFVGENGTGKSTLVEAIAVAAGFNEEGGSKNFQFETVRRADPDDDSPFFIHLTRSPRWPSDGYFLRAESFFNVATEVDRLGVTRGYGGVSLHAQSHGEAFMALLLNRFLGDGLYILDEPEAALSPMRQLAMLARIHDLVRAGSQFLIATHSPILMAYPGATILLLEDGIREVAYEDTEHYTVTRDFFNHRAAMLRELFAE